MISGVPGKPYYFQNTRSGDVCFFSFTKPCQEPFLWPFLDMIRSLSSLASKDTEIHARVHFHSHNATDLACSDFHIELILKVAIRAKLSDPGLAYQFLKFWTDVCFLSMFLKTTA